MRRDQSVGPEFVLVMKGQNQRVMEEYAIIVGHVSLWCLRQEHQRPILGPRLMFYDVRGLDLRLHISVNG